jgi:hypothetical protein
MDLHPCAARVLRVSGKKGLRAGFAQVRSPRAMTTHCPAKSAKAAPKPRHREKLNDINDRHKCANPLPVSAAPPLLSYSQNSLFYGVGRARHRHPHRSSAQTGDASPMLHRSMILAEIAKAQ